MKRLVEWWRNRYGVTIRVGQKVRIRHGLFNVFTGEIEHLQVSRHVGEPDIAEIRLVQKFRRLGK